MDIYLILLRIVHILFGVFWVGSTWTFAGFIEPSAAALGRDGGKFISYMTSVRRFPVYASIAATVNVIAGVLLYFNRFGGINVTTGQGIVFTVAGLCAIIAWLIGAGVVGPTAAKLGRLGGEIQKAGKPPAPAQLAEIGRLQNTLKQLSLVVTILLVLAVLGMASGRLIV